MLHLTSDSRDTGREKLTDSSGPGGLCAVLDTERVRADTGAGGWGGAVC